MHLVLSWMNVVCDLPCYSLVLYSELLEHIFIWGLAWIVNC